MNLVKETTAEKILSRKGHGNVFGMWGRGKSGTSFLSPKDFVLEERQYRVL